MTISGFIAYVKQLWKNKPDTSTPLSAARLGHMEDGIKGNSDAIEKLAAAVVSQIVNSPDKIASMAALHSVNQQVAQLNSDLGALDAEQSKYILMDTAKVRFITSATSVMIDVYDSDNTYYRISLRSDVSKILFQRNNGTATTTVFEK